MACSLCRKSAKLVKAHIIPESFFRKLRPGEKAPLLVSSDSSTPDKRSPIGVYDKGILCAACEARFGDWDSYGAELLINNLQTFREIHEGAETVAIAQDTYDYPKLKLFFMAVLWRAGVSTHDFYRRVNLGPHEPKLRQMLESKDPGGVDDFTVVLSNFVSTRNLEKLIQTIMDPFEEKWDGVNAYRLYFGQVVAYIKVDQRPFNDQLRSIALMPTRPLCLANRIFESSNDIKPMNHLAQLPSRNEA